MKVCDKDQKQPAKTVTVTVSGDNNKPLSKWTGDLCASCQTALTALVRGFATTPEGPIPSQPEEQKKPEVTPQAFQPGAVPAK
jgi:hypothetical protein